MPGKKKTIHEIAITLTAQGLDYGPDEHIEVRPGQQVKWRSDDCNFAIFFSHAESPFSPKKIVIPGLIGKPTSACTAKKLGQKEKKPFKYFVAALAPGANQLVTDDPEIIIDDPGGGGAKRSAKSKKKQSKKK